MYEPTDSDTFLRRLKLQPNVNFTQLTKMVLDFQLKAHTQYLSAFNKLFARIDADHDGLVNRAEFERLLSDL